MLNFSKILAVLPLLFCVGCGISYTSPPNEKDICLGQIDPVVTKAITGAYKDCMWTDNLPHVILDTTLCEKATTSGISRNTYERWTFAATGTVFLLKDGVQIIYFVSVDQPSCVEKYYPMDRIDNPLYTSDDCKTITEVKCSIPQTGDKY